MLFREMENWAFLFRFLEKERGVVSWKLLLCLFISLKLTNIGAETVQLLVYPKGGM